MKGQSIFRRCIVITVISALMFQLAACGTLMYPERKGQINGKIDPNVAILDGLGLLLFIIPGVIAFAVDFATGTIYLPGSSAILGTENQLEGWATLTVPAENMTREGFESVIAEHAHVHDALSSKNGHVYEVGSLSEASQTLAMLSR